MPTLICTRKNPRERHNSDERETIFKNREASCQGVVTPTDATFAKYKGEQPAARRWEQQAQAQQLAGDKFLCSSNYNKRKLTSNQDHESSNKKRHDGTGSGMESPVPDEQASSLQGGDLINKNEGAKQDDGSGKHSNDAPRREDDESEASNVSPPMASYPECMKSSHNVTSSTVSPTQLSPSPASFVADLVNCLLHPHATAGLQETPSALIVLLAIKKLRAHIENSETHDACAVELAYCGVYLAVVEAMKEHHSHVAIQLEAIKLLWSCAVNDLACRRVLRQFGVVHMVTKALKTHSDNIVLHQMGYGLLSELILLPQEYHDALGDAPDLLQVIPVAMSVLETRIESARFVKRVTSFLLRMFRFERENTKKTIIAADGLKITFDAMHKGNDESQQRVRELMKALL